MKPESEGRQIDAVDVILAQWRRERPDLELEPMGVIGRVTRCAAILQRRLEETFARFGMSAWEFDMLATLRRAGAPYCLAPTALFSALMVTSGTMTHRLQRLESSGLVERVPNAKDARSTLVQLTPKGLALIDRAIEAHVANEAAILGALPAASMSELDGRLSELLVMLEGPHAGASGPEGT